MTDRNESLASILIVDDDAGQRSLFETVLEANNFHVLSASNGDVALSILRDQQVAMVISDVRMPGMTGMELFNIIREENPTLPVLLVTAYGQVRDAVDAVKGGAIDYLEKPIDFNDLLASVRRALHLDSGGESVTAPARPLPDGVVSESPQMRSLFDRAALVADSDVRVLITGESGVGKEVVADVIHAWSRRSEKPIVKVNCAAIPETLLESELFGHDQGAFTGATKSRIGRFEESDGGTIFLDEIAEMSPALQAKLLHVTQAGTFSRVGSNKVRKTDVRLLAATNRNLEEEIEQKRFREDLYYRLNVIQLHVPPLRERLEDLFALAQHFARQLSHGRPRLSSTAIEHLRHYAWPGNVRELENAMQYAVLMAQGDVIMPEHLPPRLYSGGTAAVDGESRPHAHTMEDIERAAILSTLRAHCNNQRQAADALGISRRTLSNKLRKWRKQGFNV